MTGLHGTTNGAPRQKLIEVALPLDDINVAAAKEKSIRHGHPSTLHLWWARRPLAACRAVLFASLVDDPSSPGYPWPTGAAGAAGDGTDPDRPRTVEEQDAERERLFGIIRRLVRWENSTNAAVLDQARAEILRCTGGNPPPVLDPFCGGGSIPLEAQRLGLEAHGSDLNPVAVLITKALVEFPPRFAGRPPVNPTDRDSRLRPAPSRWSGAQGSEGRFWPGATGLAADVRHYGAWMRAAAAKRIGHLYPTATLPPALGGDEATVIAWLWARTVTCPNPACGARMPLVASFWLSTKPGKKTWAEPVVNPDTKSIRFDIRTGHGEAPVETVTRKGAYCIVCKTAVPFDHIRREGKARGLGRQLMAVVAEGRRGRVYVSPSDQQVEVANRAEPDWVPSTPLPTNPRDFKTPNYGLTTFGDLFTPRQLVALTTFGDLVGEAREKVRRDAAAAGLPDDGLPLAEGGAGAQAYADAVATYLAFALSKMADRGSSICTWFTERDSTRPTFARQAIPMTWDFAELNTLLKGTGSFSGAVGWTAESIEGILEGNKSGEASQRDATTLSDRDVLISTDPPYYDNVGYADLSDFFYVWLRRSLAAVHPALFGTMLVPKSDELIASPYRHDGSKKDAQRFFETGLHKSFTAMRRAQHPDYPMTVYYAFKQAEAEADTGANGYAGLNGGGNGVVTASTGWETMLAGLLDAGFAITGTWPMQTELSNRMIGRGTNALASSIVLVCRPRHVDADQATRRDFVGALRRELPAALVKLQHGNVAPVDLAQATIGPGMAVFSRYAKVLEADGSAMGVRTALQLINRELDAYLEAQEGELDADTRFCVAWFEQYGFLPAAFGEADVLARAKDTSVGGLERAGVLVQPGGKVRLLRREELDPDWDPRTDARATVWEGTQQLVGRLARGGEAAAAELLVALGPGPGEAARALAYRLYSLCERKRRADEAIGYNDVVVAWPSIQQQAADHAAAKPVFAQTRLGEG